jgi:hypothetical protein
MDRRLITFTRAYALCAIWLSLAWSLCAQDTIRYTAGPAFSFPGDGDSASLDFDHDGSADLSFSGGLFLCTTDIPVSGCTTAYSILPMSTNSLLCNGSQLLVMPAGTLIGAGTVPEATWKGYSSTALATYSFSPRFGTAGWGGPLNTAREGYFGVRFQMTDGQHYGWVRARMPATETNTFEFTPIIMDWAYETQPDTPIKAGAVPVAAVAAPKIVRPEKLRLEWQSQVGLTYQIQFKDRLESFGWTNLDIIVIATATNTIVDIPMKGSAGFYQAVRTE